MATQYNKLVRDNIPDIIRSKGETAKIHVASNEEYWQKLLEKLTEEVGEFIKDQNIEELADLLEVIDAIVTAKGFSRDEINLVKTEKAKEKGKFEKRIILEES